MENKLKSVSKKGQVTAVLIMIFVLLISGFIILNFYLSTEDMISSETENLACRAWIDLYSNTPTKNTEDVAKLMDINSFISVMNKRCKVDEITIDTDNKEEIYEAIGGRMADCWYRYGEGESDFLSNFGTTGNWCFLCGKIKFEDEARDIPPIEYNDLVTWLYDTEYKNLDDEEDSDGDGILTYGEYVNLVYYDISNNELEDLDTDIKELLHDDEINDEPAYKDIINVMLGQYQTMEDLRLKEVNTVDETYIVYRFNRVDKSFSEKLTDATGSAVGAGITTIGLSMMVDAILWGTVAAVGCALTPATGGLAGVVCVGAGAKTLQGLGKATVRGKKFTDKVFDIKTKMNQYRKFTNPAANSIHIMRKIGTNVGDFRKYADDIRKINPNLATKMDGIIKRADELGIDDISKINDISVDRVNELNKMRDLVEDSVLDAKDFVNKNSNNDKYLTDLTKIQQDIGKLDLRNSDDKAKFADYFYTFMFTIGAVVGGDVGLNYNDNSNQYVDIMTKEEYFRSCGTMRYDES